MIVRLLVVVLTLIGAVPIRICTCGAAHHHDAAPQPIRELPAGVAPAPAHEHHDADCHAVKPRPLMSLGLSCVLVDAPPADCLSVSLPEGIRLEPSPGHLIRDVHPPPGRCEFLGYTVLRN